MLLSEGFGWYTFQPPSSAVSTTLVGHYYSGVYRVTSGGRSFSVVDISVSGATISYLDDYRAFNVPTGQWSSVWRRGNGPLLDKDEIVEITVFLRNLYPPLGKTRISASVCIPSMATC